MCSIDYAAILHSADSDDLAGVIDYLSEVLPDEWCATYRLMTPTETNIFQFSDHGFEYLFDLAADLIRDGIVSAEESVEDRVVAVWGRSQPSSIKRDASRMRGFLGGPLADDESGATDKGHFMGHKLGGGMDVNLFPQRRDINRGWSERGKVFRAMERYCASHAGTFCFSRPIYADRSWRPASLEYGILIDRETLWVERFDN